MPSSSCFRILIRFAILLGCCATARVANASPLFFSGLQFNDPVFQPGVNDVIISGATVNGAGYSYFYSAEFCMSGSCSFTSPVNPSALELGNLSLGCSTSSAISCGPLDVTFQAGFDATPGSSELISLVLGNTVLPESAFSGFTRICFSDMSNFCAADLTGISSFSFAFSNNSFSGSASGGYIVGPAGPFQFLGLFHIDDLANGGSLNIGHSLDLTTSQAVGSGAPVPEPSPLLLALFGAGALVGLRLVRNRRRLHNS